MSGYPPPAPRPAPMSRQMRDYLARRQHGHSCADSAVAAGIPITEARLIDKDLGL